MYLCSKTNYILCRRLSLTALIAYFLYLLTIRADILLIVHLAIGLLNVQVHYTLIFHFHFTYFIAPRGEPQDTLMTV